MQPYRRKLLMVAYRFPPQSGGGAQRMLKLAKYLGDFGWEPVVQTARNPYWPRWDAELLAELPRGIRVHRTPTFEFERFEERLARPFRRRSDGGSAQSGSERAGPQRALRALRNAIHRYAFVPDAQIAWLPGAFLHGLLIARRERVDALFTSSPPNSVHLLGRLMAAALGRPWVADFRDPWTDGVRRRKAYVGNAGREALESAAERMVLRRADRILVSAEPLRARFLAKYDFLSPERVVVLPNGFDPDDFAGCETGGRELEAGRFHVTASGTMESMFDFGPFLRAVAELVAEDADLRADLRINLVGTTAARYGPETERLGLADRVRFYGWVSKSQNVRYLQQSDALLMHLIPQRSGTAEKLPARAFECLYLRKPLLFLSVPGATTEFLAQSGLVTSVAPDDVAGIKRALRERYARRGAPAGGDPAFIARFDRRRLTGRLAAILDELTRTPALMTARPAREEAPPSP
ncbi:MAG: glycosyltransferase family 4 protein [Deltaproteobacteria bacterium]|nr:MAG: glycosyltransferase family 4 protein [Deltaproteobacteria bacterium]